MQETMNNESKDFQKRICALLQDAKHDAKSAAQIARGLVVMMQEDRCDEQSARKNVSKNKEEWWKVISPTAQKTCCCCTHCGSQRARVVVQKEGAAYCPDCSTQEYVIVEESTWWSKSNNHCTYNNDRNYKRVDNFGNVLNKRQNCLPPRARMSRELIDRIKCMFSQVEAPFAIHSARRKNMLNYNYIIHKSLQLLERDEYLVHFPVLKTRGKLIELEAIWKKICRDLGWAFYPAA